MKKLLALLLVLAMVLSMAACVSTKPAETIPEKPGDNAPTSDTPQTGELTETAKASFTLIVVHADGTEKEFSYETDEEFLGPVLTEAGLIQGNDGPYGLEITHVDGEQAIYNTDKAYWSLYEGEEYALQGIDTTPVVDGGTYKLVYTPA